LAAELSERHSVQAVWGGDLLAPARDSQGPDTAATDATQENSTDTRDLDARLVKESFAQLQAVGPTMMEYFYARLFIANPEIRSLFPMTMTVQRESTLRALTELISRLDNRPGCTELLAKLGRDHRKFGVTTRHYDAFFAALRDCAKHFTGTGWTPETAAAWDRSLEYFAAMMREAAALDALKTPPWWVAEIVGRELRSPGVAVLTLRPDKPFSYRPGQYVPVQVTRWPRIWRPFSIANSPRPSGLIKLHVRAVPGGLVSNTLVYRSDIGDSVLLGAPRGDMTLGPGHRDLLCVAGGTGLAPLKAIIEHALTTTPLRRAAPPGPSRLEVQGPLRKITVFVGARQHFDLYDLEDLQLLELACPGLQVIPVLSDEPGYRGRTGVLPDVVQAHGLFENAEAYICGPAPMVRQTAAVLSAGIPPSRIHHDPLP
jgi:NAD(P)H-flavin reductase/hemoglobin-like flavoprotein